MRQPSPFASSTSSPFAVLPRRPPPAAPSSFAQAGACAGRRLHDAKSHRLQIPPKGCSAVLRLHLHLLHIVAWRRPRFPWALRRDLRLALLSPPKLRRVWRKQPAPRTAAPVCRAFEERLDFGSHGRLGAPGQAQFLCARKGAFQRSAQRHARCQVPATGSDGLSRRPPDIGRLDPSSYRGPRDAPSFSFSRPPEETVTVTVRPLSVGSSCLKALLNTGYWTRGLPLFERFKNSNAASWQEKPIAVTASEREWSRIVTCRPIVPLGFPARQSRCHAPRAWFRLQVWNQPPLCSTD